jgi:hypothetical protein
MMQRIKVRQEKQAWANTSPMPVNINQRKEVEGLFQAV